MGKGRKGAGGELTSSVACDELGCVFVRLKAAWRPASLCRHVDQTAAGAEIPVARTGESRGCHS